MKIQEIMTSDIATCNPETPASEAAKRMWAHDCGVLPVVDGDERRLLGVVTDRDLCMASFRTDLPLSRLPVAKAMSTGVHTLLPEHDARTAHELMRRHRVRRLPVVDSDHRTVGMLSLNDLCRFEPDGGETAKTLAEISRPMPSPRA